MFFHEFFANLDDIIYKFLIAFDGAGTYLVIVGMTVCRGAEVKVGVTHHRHLGVVAGIFGKQTAEHLERNASVMESVILPKSASLKKNIVCIDNSFFFVTAIKCQVPRLFTVFLRVSDVFNKIAHLQPFRFPSYLDGGKMPNFCSVVRLQSGSKCCFREFHLFNLSFRLLA